MKAQVFTTTRSAASAEAAGAMPSASSVPTSLSESTWFFGQPRVSTKNVRSPDIGGSGYWPGSRRNDLPSAVRYAVWASARPWRGHSNDASCPVPDSVT